MNGVLLSLNAEGVCGVCGESPPDYHALRCDTCACDWHMKCLQPPVTQVPEGEWSCPDCSIENFISTVSIPAVTTSAENSLVKQIREIESDRRLTAGEKAMKRQLLMSNGVVSDDETFGDEQFMCLFCRNSLDRPVTTPCGHNFCLKCILKAFSKTGNKCSKCRRLLPRRFMSNPRINLVLVAALRMEKLAANGFSAPSTFRQSTKFLRDQDRPDTAFLTERAVRPGRANASCGRKMVKPPLFGPITGEHDDERRQGVLVGDTWADRLDCAQWGAHMDHISGICGPKWYVGATSVALSGGYKDDEDHGEWFLYSGSGGRDLSGNKRTSSKQSFDQVFEKRNRALVTSCLNGYPLRVVRSHKERRSAYAPARGIRYDGIYRIEKCWRKTGVQKFVVCRYLFVRCDNEPAPWTSDTVGDRPRPLPDISHMLKGATDIIVRDEAPAWDWKEEEGIWGWTRPPPVEPPKREPGSGGRNRLRSFERALRTRFRCGICKNVLQLPLSTPCGHSYCESCLTERFGGQTEYRQRGGRGQLRAQKTVKQCPGCKADITEFMRNPAVNREMDEIIQRLREAIETGAAELAAEDNGGANGEIEVQAAEGGEGKEADKGRNEKGKNIVDEQVENERIKKNKVSDEQVENSKEDDKRRNVKGKNKVDEQVENSASVVTDTKEKPQLVKVHSPRQLNSSLPKPKRGRKPGNALTISEEGNKCCLKRKREEQMCSPGDDTVETEVLEKDTQITKDELKGKAIILIDDEENDSEVVAMEVDKQGLTDNNTNSRGREKARVDVMKKGKEGGAQAKVQVRRQYLLRNRESLLKLY